MAFNISSADKIKKNNVCLNLKQSFENGQEAWVCNASENKKVNSIAHNIATSLQEEGYRFNEVRIIAKKPFLGGKLKCQSMQLVTKLDGDRELINMHNVSKKGDLYYQTAHLYEKVKKQKKDPSVKKLKTPASAPTILVHEKKEQPTEGLKWKKDVEFTKNDNSECAYIFLKDVPNLGLWAEGPTPLPEIDETLNLSKSHQ